MYEGSAARVPLVHNVATTNTWHGAVGRDNLPYRICPSWVRAFERSNSEICLSSTGNSALLQKMDRATLVRGRGAHSRATELTISCRLSAGPYVAHMRSYARVCEARSGVVCADRLFRREDHRQLHERARVPHLVPHTLARLRQAEAIAVRCIPRALMEPYPGYECRYTKRSYGWSRTEYTY